MQEQMLRSKAALDFNSKLWKNAESGISEDEGTLQLWLWRLIISFRQSEVWKLFFALNNQLAITTSLGSHSVA